MRRLSGYALAAGVIHLEEPYPGPLAPGRAFEVASPEAAPILAARLVTGSPAGSPRH